MNYLFHICFLICIYIILGVTLDLVLGHCGLLSLCHAAFYGIGAYTSALLMTKLGVAFLPSLPLSMLVCGGIAYAVSIPAIRLRGDFFVLATLGFQTIAFALLYNWTDLTNGPFGISGIPRPALLGWEVTTTASYFLIALVVTVGVVSVFWRLSNSPFGRALHAVRDDEIAAQALGKKVGRFRRTSFALAGAFAGLAGVLFSGYTMFIDPTSFTLDESVFILSVVVIGGSGNTRGPVVGAFILILIPELLRLLAIPDSMAANGRQILYGLLLVLAMRLRPQGVAGNYAFD